MGKKLLKEMDRVVLAVSASEARRPQQETADASVAGGIYSASSNLAAQYRRFWLFVLPNSAERFSDSRLAFAESVMAGTDSASAPFDPLIFDNIADIDLFGMFDPAFDLDGFDACLESNLNPAFPNPW